MNEKIDALVARLDAIKELAAMAVTQDHYTAAGEKAIRALPEIIAALRQQAEQPEDSRCPPTFRREAAVETLIGLGWKWDGQKWAAEQGGRVDVDSIALAAAQDIAVMWGRDRSQFVSKIQGRVAAAMIALAQNAQGDGWAVVLMSVTDEVTPVLQPLEGWRDLPNGNYRLYTHAERARVPELDAEDWKVLQRLRNALPDVGLNGWHRGVTVLSKILSAAPSQPEDAA